MEFAGSVWGWSSKMLHSIGEAWLGRRPDTAKVAGTNPAQPITAKLATNNIPSHLLQLQKEGYAKWTIISHGRILRHLSKNCDINNPDAVTLFISEKEVSPARKARISDAYLKYAKSLNLPFIRPRYQAEDKLPFIPLQSEIESILEYSKSLRHSTYLRLAYETGGRAGELSRLQLKDFDFQRGTVRLTPEKHGRAREIKISPRLISQLMQVYAKYNSHPLPNTEAARKHLERIRKQLAKISCNPRLNLIHLHTLRHFRATTWYFQTKDLLYCQQQLGHRSITNTLRYVRLVDWKSDEYVCKAAKSLAEASELIEAGFDFVTTIGEIGLYRKRK